MRSRRAYALAAVVAASSCAGDARIDLRAERGHLLAADSAYAAAGAQKNLIEALIAPLAPDGVLITPGDAIARGAEEARAALAANPNNAAATIRWSAIRADVSGDGTRGYTYGYIETTLADGTSVPGKYLAYWAKQPDGSWKIAGLKRAARAPGPVPSVPPAGFETPRDAEGRSALAPAAVERARIAMMDADRAFSDLAQRAGNGEAFARYAAPDGVQSGSPAQAEWSFGPEKIRELFVGEPSTFTWGPEIGDVAASGDLGFTVGFVRSGGRVMGKYLTVWRKQRSGEWRYVAD